MASAINTATGTVQPEALGRTMMHEHLVVGLPGWELDTAHPGPGFREAVAICVDKLATLKAAGIDSLVDPCPADLGRDPVLMAEVAARTGLTIVGATGLFSERRGSNQYWRAQMATAEQRGQSLAPYLAETYIHELTQGIGSSGVKAGIIKVGTDRQAVTPYERMVLHAAAIASKATGAPITTHTENGELGREQLAILQGHGVPPHRIIIGHSCGSLDPAYHRHITNRGAYVGFDRFGYISPAQGGVPDDQRINALVSLIEDDYATHVIVSCDTICALRGNPAGFAQHDALARDHCLHFVRHIVPALRARGVGIETIDTLVIDNPRRYFADEPIGRVAMA